MKRNITGPPVLPLVSYTAYASVTDDDSRRRQTPVTVTSLAPLHYV